MKTLNQISQVAYSAADPVSSGYAELSSNEVTEQNGCKAAYTGNEAGSDNLFFPQMTFAMMQHIMTAIIVIAHIIIIIR